MLGFDELKFNINKSEKGVSKSVEVNPGDLIMSICATIGKPIILNMEACIHDGFVYFSKLSRNVDINHLFSQGFI